MAWRKGKKNQAREGEEEGYKSEKDRAEEGLEGERGKEGHGWRRKLEGRAWQREV